MTTISALHTRPVLYPVDAREPTTPRHERQPTIATTRSAAHSCAESLRSVGQDRGERGDQVALGRALSKLEGALDLILEIATDAVSDASMRSYWHQGCEARDAISRAGDRMGQRQAQRTSLQQERIQQLHARTQARSEGGFWRSLSNLFRSIAKVASLACAAASGGGLGLVAAATVLTSALLQHAGAPAWVSVSVGLTGAIIGGGVAAGAVARGLAAKMTRCAKLGLELAAAGCDAAESSYHADALDAQADLFRIKHARAQTLEEESEDKELIARLGSQGHEAAQKLLHTISLSHGISLRAIGA